MHYNLVGDSSRLSLNKVRFYTENGHFAFLSFTRMHQRSMQHFFTVLHGMQTRSSDENSVHLSVCPSVKHMDCDKTEERYV